MNLETREMCYIPVRTAVATYDSVLDGTTAGLTYAFTDKPSVAKEIPNEFNVVELGFYGTTTNNTTINYKIYLYREKGAAALACTGVLTLGTAKTGATDTLYVDTITVTDTWASPCRVIDSATNRQARLAIDVMGYRYIYVEFTDSSSNQLVSVSCEMSGY